MSDAPVEILPPDPLWASQFLLEQAALSDALRASPALCVEYEALKRQLAAAHRHDREAYTEGKSAFVARVLAGGRA